MAQEHRKDVQVSYDGPEADSIRARSASQWQAALRQAESMTRVPSSSLDLERTLVRVPSLPDTIPKESTSIVGYSTWINSDPTCRLSKVEKELFIALRKRHPTTCLVSSSSHFARWDEKQNNGIALLILAWAYVLSANLAERQGLGMEYGAVLEAPDGPELHLSYATPPERAWWKAIVSPGTGWSIAGGQISPWAVRIEDLGIRIAGDADADPGRRPPTSRQAAQYVARLCSAYDLGSQCSAALAAALSLPLHASIAPLKSTTIELPPPSFTTGAACPEQQRFPPLPKEFRHLGYYLSLSLSPWILGPALWSVFWDPAVPCHFAGAWLGPILAVLDPVITSNNMELLAKLLSFTKVAPLWLGVALCGRRAIVKSILPSLAELRDYPHARPVVDSAAWTGVPQSFMDIHPPGPYLRDGMIARADVWRLRHDCYRQYEDGTFVSTPAYGWPPFGEMRAEDVELEIRDHLTCSHQWKYGWWTWLPDRITDAGFLRTRPAEPPSESKAVAGSHPPREPGTVGQNLCELSKMATESVFQWCGSQVERGFAGSVVKRRAGPNVAPREMKERGALDREAIHDWIRSIGS
ncbi:hypothetical protein VTK73DRAFT_9677 [Phialemonium thermophilum]|uniref:Uncharacterized protein n=1 Tax=Phialemonium thermophilum TaxID=223376 RepID=A0ABR3W139_9PEZI